jgi:CheY-like chemotaxis protein
VRAPLTHVMSVCESLQSSTHSASDLQEVQYSCQTISDIMDSWLIMLSESEKQSTAGAEHEQDATAAVADEAQPSSQWMSSNESLALLLHKLTVYGSRVILLSGKPLALRTEDTTSCYTLNFSNKMLQHVLINLVSNAVKYSQTGDILITAQFNDTKHELSVTVRDQGIGISAQHLPHLFNRFYRIKGQQHHQPAASSTDCASFGVGLAIVQSLLTKMRGSIRVSSELGSGTAFTVTVPCYHIIQENTQSAAAEGDDDLEQQEQRHCDLSTVRVLLAEDNRICSRLFAMQLSDCARVTVIDDGALVMDALRSCEHDVLLLDGTLPHQCGHEIMSTLLQEVSMLSLVPAVVTISGGHSLLTTADWTPITVEHCKKPFTKQQLLAAIAKVLERQQQQQQQQRKQ